MQPIQQWLTERKGEADIRVSPTLSHLRGSLLADWEPDLAVVCQSWPDEFSAIDVTAALGRWPLALWVCCFGAWCESDGRTRSIWPIGLRVPARSAEVRLTHLWQILSQQAGEPLPITASRDESFEFDLPFARDPSRVCPGLSCKVAAVMSPDPAVKAWLSDLLRTLIGACCIDDLGQLSDGDLLVCDTDPDLATTARWIENFHRRQPGVRIAALCGLAHPEDQILLSDAGTERIFMKTSLSAELREWLAMPHGSRKNPGNKRELEGLQ